MLPLSPGPLDRDEERTLARRAASPGVAWQIQHARFATAPFDIGRKTCKGDGAIRF